MAGRRSLSMGSLMQEILARCRGSWLGAQGGPYGVPWGELGSRQGGSGVLPLVARSCSNLTCGPSLDTEPLHPTTECTARSCSSLPSGLPLVASPPRPHLEYPAAHWRRWPLQGGGEQQGKLQVVESGRAKQTASGPGVAASLQQESPTCGQAAVKVEAAEASAAAQGRQSTLAGQHASDASVAAQHAAEQPQLALGLTGNEEAISLPRSISSTHPAAAGLPAARPGPLETLGPTSVCVSQQL